MPLLFLAFLLFAQIVQAADAPVARPAPRPVVEAKVLGGFVAKPPALSGPEAMNQAASKAADNSFTSESPAKWLLAGKCWVFIANNEITANHKIRGNYSGACPQQRAHGQGTLNLETAGPDGKWNKLPDISGEWRLGIPLEEGGGNQFWLGLGSKAALYLLDAPSPHAAIFALTPVNVKARPCNLNGLLIITAEPEFSYKGLVKDAATKAKDFCPEIRGRPLNVTISSPDLKINENIAFPQLVVGEVRDDNITDFNLAPKNPRPLYWQRVLSPIPPPQWGGDKHIEISVMQAAAIFCFALGILVLAKR